MSVWWSRTALRHLLSIHDHIAKDSSRYAIRMVDRLTTRSIQIERSPLSGQMVPEFDDPSIREVIEGSYRVLYEIADDTIFIIAVVHGAQQLPIDVPRERNM